MPPILGVSLGLVVVLVGAWLLTMITRWLFRSPFGRIVLAALAVAGLVAGVGYLVKSHGHPRDAVAVRPVGAASNHHY
jgi:hypothetical protein